MSPLPWSCRSRTRWFSGKPDARSHTHVLTSPPSCRPMTSNARSNAPPATRSNSWSLRGAFELLPPPLGPVALRLLYGLASTSFPFPCAPFKACPLSEGVPTLPLLEFGCLSLSTSMGSILFWCFAANDRRSAEEAWIRVYATARWSLKLVMSWADAGAEPSVAESCLP